jgi:hypothetical protein
VDNPKGMVAFMRHESEGHLYCEVKIYFSPMSVAINAKPSPEDLSVLAGCQYSWRVLLTSDMPNKAMQPLMLRVNTVISKIEFKNRKDKSTRSVNPKF